LVAEGSGEFKGMKFALIQDDNEMRLAEEPAGSPKKPSKVDQNKREQFVITTPDSHQMQVIPAINDPKGLLEVIPGEGRVEMGEQGDVFLELPGQKHPHVVGMANPSVGTAPPDMSPGVHFAETPEGQQRAMLIYEDGTMQEMQPTVMAPRKFIKKGQQIDGVEEITHQMDGTLKVIYNGQNLRLEPTFDVQTEELAEGEQVEPEISIKDDGNLEYAVQNGMELLKFRVIIRVVE